MSLQSAVPLEPVNSCFRMGVEANAATLPDSSSNGDTCRRGSSFNLIMILTQFPFCLLHMYSL